MSKSLAFVDRPTFRYPDPRSQVAGGDTQVVIRTKQFLLILAREVRWQTEIPKWLSVQNDFC